MIHHTAMIGSASLLILNSPNPKYEINSDETVVPMLAQIITQIELYKANTQAQVNARTRRVTRLLLWSSAVATVPVATDENGQFVNFWSSHFTLFHQSTLIAVSKTLIQNKSIQTHATSMITD